MPIPPNTTTKPTAMKRDAPVVNRRAHRTVGTISARWHNAGITDEFIVNALAVIAWLAWTQLALAFLAEAVAAFRGRQPRDLPIAPGLQAAAARLVAGIIMAYQGFADGIKPDAVALDLFAASGLQFVVASSFSKSFSLYGERVGALTIVTDSKDESARVLSQVKRQW